jgi:thymidylate synthase (FAD)
MRIVQPYARLLEPELLQTALRRVEAAGRVSHRSEEDQKETTWDRFIRSVVMNHGDWSIVEHVTASVELYVDRGITHEIVRHRLFSYTQESTRFVNYKNKMPPSFVYPDVGIECPECLHGNEVAYYHGPHERDSTSDREDDPPRGWQHKASAVPGSHPAGWVPCNYDPVWLSSIHEAERGYRRLLEDKRWPPQLARSVFPNALASKVIMTGNLRSWRHFLRMRTTKEAHPQMRQVTVPLLEQFQGAVPILYEDLIPNARQADNVRLPC